MITVRLDGKEITSWAAFHDECMKAFGFPDFYGRNMDAWIDCLSDLRDEQGMTRFRLQPNELLRIEVTDADSMQRCVPGILACLQDCIDEINRRYTEYGDAPAVELLLR
jgi:hypothetical protein